MGNLENVVSNTNILPNRPDIYIVEVIIMN